MELGITFGIFTIIIFLGGLVWIYFRICKITKSKFVRGVAIVAFSIIIAMTLASMYIVYQTKGSDGLNEYFTGAGKTFIQSIKETHSY